MDDERALEFRQETPLSHLHEALAAGRTIMVPDMHLSMKRIEDRLVRFATDKRRDPIQRANRNGQFYEQEELALLKDVVAPDSLFVDIGANIGNHTLFAALFLKARRVISFEPNPLAYRMLVANVLANDLQGVVDLSHIGMGLSDTASSGFGMTEREKNLGAARMIEGAGDIAVAIADTRLSGVDPDFIKIDVEGMEMGVLRGLKKTLKRAQPKLLIEVDKVNYDAFDQWLETADYTTLETIQRYSTNKNFLIAPKGA